MVASGQAGLRAAAEGRAAYEEFLKTADFDPEMFTTADQAALAGPWAWLARIAGAAIEAGPEGAIEDELALTMCLLGCTSLEELTRAHVQRAIA